MAAQRPRPAKDTDERSAASASPGWDAAESPRDGPGAGLQPLLASLFDEFPGPLALLAGPELVYALANPPYRAIVGGREVLGLPLRKALPELEGQEVVALIERVHRTGEPFVGRQFPVRLDTGGGVREVFFDFVLAPYRDLEGKVDGVLAYGYEVTELVQARHKAESAVSESRASHRLLQTLVDGLTDPIFVKDPEGRSLLMNKACRDVLGLGPDDHLGRTNEEVMGPEAGAKVTADDLRIIASGEGRTYEETLPLRGELRTYLTTKAPLRDEQGAVVGLFGIARDISDRKRDEEALRLSESRVRTLIDQSPLAIQVFDKEGACVQANEAWERLWGASRDLLADYNVRRDPQLAAKGVAPAIERAYAGEAVKIPPVSYDPKEIGKPGRVRWVEAHVYPMKGRQGEVREVVLVLEDVTERITAEQDLKAANERLRELDRLKTQLINTASHELRTPLTPMGLQLDLLRSDDFGPLNERQRKALQVLDRNTKRLSLLLQDMLDVSRLQSGRLVMQRDPLDLASLLREAGESFQEAARQAEVAVEVQAEGDLHLEADGHRISQVLYNLLSNALKFTRSGGRVTLAARREGPEVLVEVADDGVGLTAEQIAMLFQPFTQVHEPTQRSRSGTGLGLYISRGIVEQHGGRIWAISAGPGQGATFGFALPAPR